MGVREYFKRRARKRVFFQAADYWVSAEGSLGLFHPLVMAIADFEGDHWLRRLDAEIIEDVLTLWLDSWTELEIGILSNLGETDDEYSILFYEEMMPVISDYGEKLHCILLEPEWDAGETIANLPDYTTPKELILSLADNSDWEGSTTISNLYAVNEEVQLELRYLRVWLDEHATSLGLDVPKYRYNRKAANRLAGQRFARILNYLRGIEISIE